MDRRLKHQTSNGSGKTIVLATFGSLGDLYPYMALAQELQNRGYSARIATCEQYQKTIETAGIEFCLLRPNGLPQEPGEIEFLSMMMDSQRGMEYIINYLLMPYLRTSYSDLINAVQGADLLLTHPLTLVASLVAEKTGIPWVSTILSPSVLMSAYDVPPEKSTQSRYEKAMAVVARDSLLRLFRCNMQLWSAPLEQLQEELGLEARFDPLFEGQFAPLVLGLFSQTFASVQPDWPPQTQITGFPFYRQNSESGLSPELQQFLHAGPPPIVFTLGSTAVLTPGNFYEQGMIAAQKLGYRAVLMMGKAAHQLNALGLPPGVIAIDYSPHADIFPFAAAIVHHGGMGTTAEALRAGHPMLVIPYHYDQPDNATRVVQMGVGRTLDRHLYQASTVLAELKVLLGDPSYATRVAEVSSYIQTEQGNCKAVDVLETYLMTRKPET
ncbi:O-mycaminosyltylonolide 6-deoxyallosyltransferase [Planktothrix tepida]|uniref:Glycosyltransferase, MGT family n=2 Tax=Planktothrix TaxID=54304 RepID=A0A1J1LM09_9CYAN|nr:MULTISPECIES: glycosyltransferase [Planktothrix]CAD5924991.1 O-mycaminosyltylonolide 6-deoxyallosyltransferase [Planktothrix pseudagardhii]CAD5979634.1 O-mycaminosyltylonolide 6-deoxyallosyltransferase [Planktothrix tepida]CUR33507.1 Glycosyltransferase, MGT family [Planktothrix tepida PCC 9214]